MFNWCGPSYTHESYIYGHVSCVICILLIWFHTKINQCTVNLFLNLNKNSLKQIAFYSPYANESITNPTWIYNVNIVLDYFCFFLKIFSSLSNFKSFKCQSDKVKLAVVLNFFNQIPEQKKSVVKKWYVKYFPFCK